MYAQTAVIKRGNDLFNKKSKNKPQMVDQEIVDFLKQNREEIGYSLPIDEEMVDLIFEWFADQETVLSNQYCEGLYTDRAHLDLIAKGVDNFNVPVIDLADLNRKLTESR